ncbi:hypothetical protein OS189_16545 [Sulfitobacter sp. F26169L]|uniref:hypothetical protein n=1 Tax=Sulfitobacter sp. F26169L TaxID=2996015 RepID=UPI0022609047|nr:hypothetical protein [Sulfitobacter sp. F26169L]MCX7567953.1 hypothetical protein [Sulfitobacter sp. F26169L]
MTDMTPKTTDRFSAEQREVMRLVAGAIIPADPARDMPGADDPAILDDILASAGRDADDLALALDLLGASDGALTDVAEGSVLAKFRQAQPALAAVLSLVIAQCYYRDTRVLIAVGMEPRPPFPKGYPMDQGDWSLLDPVRARGPIYRAATDEGTPT